MNAIVDDGQTLWVGTGAGLFARNRDGTIDVYRQGIGPHAISNDNAYYLYRDREGYIWVGTNNGLNRIDPRTRRITQYVFSAIAPSSFGSGAIESIVEDRRGRIWTSLLGGPVNVLSNLGKGAVRLQRVVDINGIPVENVSALAEDQRGTIWASGNNTISVIDASTLRARVLSTADGVPDEEYYSGTSALAADGTIFFGGENGVAIVPAHTSETIVSSNTATPLVITSLKVAGKSLLPWQINQPGTTVDLPTDARNVTVEFAALDYAEPQAIRYTYKLDGYDTKWVDTDPGYRLATYTNLAPGHYTLHVRAADATDRRAIGEIQMGLRVPPAWFETWWFRMLVGALIAAALYGAFQIRTTIYRRRQRRLERIVAERTRELSQANAKLQEMSLTDPLTGLRNRRFLAQHIESDISITLRRYEDWLREPLSAPPEDADLLVFIIDVDHFKMVNDRFGHRAGDLVLMEMYERLHEIFRKSDFVVRWGGDEILAVARGSRRSDAGEIAERTCSAIANRPFVLDGGQTVTLTGSIGFAAFPFVPSSPHAISWTQVVEMADQALYMAKSDGRNTWFGLAATTRTEPRLLVQRLAESAAEDAIAACNLQIVCRSHGEAGKVEV